MATLSTMSSSRIKTHTLSDLSDSYRRALERRMNDIIDRSGECWVWTNHTASNGYGRIYVDGTTWLAHRAAYALWRGDIPDGHELDHLCRNTTCVNPDHLEPVVHAVNHARGDQIGAVVVRTNMCGKGLHEMTGDNVIRRPSRPHHRECFACAKKRHREYQRRRRAAGK